MANSPECSGQGQSGGLALATSQMRSSQSGSPTSNYSDTEQSFRQTAIGNQALQSQLPAEPLTEFQKFVASTTSQVLPIFGADLFRKVPSTFAPLQMTPVPADYVIGPDDVLRIRVWGQVNFQTNLRVDRSGEIFLPQIGPVHVAGTAFSALDAQLRGAIGRVYHNFDLTADMGQIRAIQVYVAGQARRPGVYTVSSLSSLVDTLFASGGPSVDGSMRHIELRRGSVVVTSFDLYDLLIHGDKSKDVGLQSGDVIFVFPVGPQAAVTGSVRNPAIYELKGNETLSGLLASAGGVSAVASDARISIERIENHRDRHAMEVANDASGLATPMTDGDLVRVVSIVPIYRNTVILRGNIANPGRFAWHPGMRISELIPDKESLITRNYWWKRAQLGLSGPEFDATPVLDPMRQPGEDQPVMVGHDQSGFSQNQNLSSQQGTGNSALAAAQTSTASAMQVQLPAPAIDWDYAVIERLDTETLKNTVVPFDLGKLVLQHDASQDLELQPGDVVSIFSEADIRVPIAKQTKLVKLEGEFVHGGVYSVEPGETLRHLVERAGGLTPNAYMFGSEFTRESTRAIQQARIDEYVRSLSMQIQHNNLALAASPVSSTQNAAVGAAAQASERDLIAGLRQIRATGRIVLAFKPDSSGTNTLPDITMEDGDRFIVPHVPATVNVVGAVYDQNSFLYAPGRKVGTYLRRAGGPTRYADQKHEFIIRADGEVLSRDATNGLWGNEFDNLRIYPGDTIVVPEKTFKPSAIRAVVDWSQMFSQLALGATALSVVTR